LNLRVGVVARGFHLIDQFIFVGPVDQDLIPDGACVGGETGTLDDQGGHAGGLIEQTGFPFIEGAGADRVFFADEGDVVLFFQEGIERSGKIFFPEGGDEVGGEPALFEDDRAIGGEAESFKIPEVGGGVGGCCQICSDIRWE